MGDAPSPAPRRSDAEKNDRALLRAARDVLAVDGAHATVAAIAARAGIGIGSLYRRYRTKDELFQHLCLLSLEEYRLAAEEGLAEADAWEGLAHYVTRAIALGSGSLAAVAGTIEITPAMAESNDRGDRAVAELIDRAHEAGSLRPDVTATDLSLLIEQLGKSPLLEQLAAQRRSDLEAAAVNARNRIIAIALDGLRAPARRPLPGEPPGHELFSERWATPPG